MMIGLLVLAGGVFLFYLGYRLKSRLDRYEFENRTDGGVVQFESFGASQAHARNQRGAQMIMVAGALVLFAGIVIAGLGSSVGR